MASRIGTERRLREIFGVLSKSVSMAPAEATVAVLCATFFVNTLAVTTPIAALLIYDRVLPNGTVPTLAVLIAGATVIVVIDAALRFSRATILMRAGTRYDHAQRERLMKRLMSRSSVPPNGLSLTRLNENLSAISVLREFRFLLLQAIVDIPFGLAFIVLIAIIGGWLALIPAGICALFAGSVFAIAHLNERASRALRVADNRQSGFIGRVFDNMRTLRAVAADVPMTGRFVENQFASSFNLRRQAFAGLIARDVNVLFSQALIASVVVASALAAIDGNLTLGGLAACTLLAGRSLEPLQTGLQVLSQYRMHRIAFDEIVDLFEGSGEAEALAPPNVAPLWSRPPPIRIEHLHVGEQGRLVRPLVDLNIDVAGGEFVTITADRGIGKTTLARALLRLVPHEGTVRIGEKVLSADNIDLVRRNLTFVSREPLLPNGRLIEILTDGDENAYADVRYLSHLTGLDEAVRRLPDGYDTEFRRELKIHPRGLCQLIAIVRGLAKKRKVMIFDDATQALDANSEQRLVQLLTMLKGEATVLFFTDKPALRALADRQMVLANGRCAVQTAHRGRG